MYNSVKNLELELFATQVRMKVVDILYKSGLEGRGGHVGGSLSCVDILVSLYHPKCGVLKYDPKNPKWEERDRFVLSAGHKAPALYAVLAKCGFFPEEELERLRKIDSRLQGHAYLTTPGVEAPSGSLGQDLSIAFGMAIAPRAKKATNLDYMVYCLLGDGELSEGQVWEAAKEASSYKVSNLCAIVDHNGLRIDGAVSEIYPIKEKFEAFGWRVIGADVPWSENRKEMELDGHDYNFLINALKEAKESRTSVQPTAVIANTIKSRGIPIMENTVSSHGRPPNKIECEDGMKYLNEKLRLCREKLHKLQKI